MDPISKDTAYLQAGIPELKEYLLSRELYWPVSTRRYDLPRLTLGGLLLALARLSASHQPIEGLTRQLEAVRSSWRAAWEAKAGREFKARFELWKNYILDYKFNPEGYADSYPHEVRYRVMLHLLGVELPSHPGEWKALNQLDEILRTALVPSTFIWETGLQEAFPSEVYWYLYGRLRT
jgi:hypothetical protein